VLIEDAQLRKELRRSSLHGDDWAYRGATAREGLHGIIQYPAMMVPAMQGDLLASAIRVRPDIQRVLDPFVGAGTTLVESLMARRAFIGYDINPLAVLACEAKSSATSVLNFRSKVESLIRRIDEDLSSKIEVAFPGRDKWFSRDAIIALCRIRRAICAEPCIHSRRLLWLALAETIRITSNARTSTFKLHIRPESELAKLQSPFDVFRARLYDLLRRLEVHLNLSGMVDSSSVEVYCSSIAQRPLLTPNFADVVLTSPPYGDNKTTVPYGQFSFLALNWIDRSDLKGDSHLFSNTHATDYASLGGRKHSHEMKLAAIVEMSKTARKSLKAIQLNSGEASNRVCGFLYDFAECVSATLQSVTPASYLFWTLGNRTVSGVKLPFAEIAAEMAMYFGAARIASIPRVIPRKRGAVRNNKSRTICEETILVMRSSL
jgi:hypothetical protein